MRCAHVQERLVLYLAGELPARENSRLIEHLAGCADCIAIAEDLAATQAHIETVLDRDTRTPATLDNRVMTAIRALPSRQRSGLRLPPVMSRPRVALAAAFCCLILIGFGVAGRIAGTSTFAIARLGSVYDRQIATAPQIQASSPGQIAQQLSSSVQFRVTAADLKSEGAVLEGGTQASVESVPVATLRYAWQGKQISLFELDPGKPVPAALRHLDRTSDSYYVHKSGDIAYVAWHSGKTDCVMVARSIPMHQLFHLACRVCEQQERLL